MNKMSADMLHIGILLLPNISMCHRYLLLVRFYLCTSCKSGSYKGLTLEE